MIKFFTVVILICSSIASPAQEGTETRLTPEQIQALSAWVESSKAQLKDALSQVKSMSRPQAKDYLESTFQKISGRAERIPGDTFLRYTLNRALKLCDLVGAAGENSFALELQTRLLWVSAESAAALDSSDFSHSAEFGVSNSEFIFSWAEAILTPDVQYKAQLMALGYLGNDLARDSQNQDFAPEISEIKKFTDEAANSKHKASDIHQQITALRAMYSLQLLHLQGESRLAELISDAGNPALDFYRKTLRNNLNDPDLDTRLRAMRGFESLDLNLTDEMKISSLIGDSSYTACYTAIQILKNINPMPAGTEDILYGAINNQKIRECRDAGIILLARARTARAQDLLNQMYHSNCLFSDIETVVQYGLRVVTSTPQPDLLSVSSHLCAGENCVGDWVATKLNGSSAIQGPIDAINEKGQLSLRTPAGANYWLNPKGLGKKVDCFQNVCQGDSGMLNETNGHKVGSAFKRLGFGLTGLDIITGDYGENEVAPYHTILEVSAVYDNGVFFYTGVSPLAANWATVDKFQKIDGSLGQQQCMVPVN